LNFKTKIVRLIASGALTCWRCHNKLEYATISAVDIDNDRISYRCTCGNSGYRTFRGMASHMRTHLDLNNPVWGVRCTIRTLFADCAVDDEDRNGDITILIGGRNVAARFVTCVICDTEFTPTEIITSNGLNYCRSCHGSTTQRCHNCGNVIPAGHVTHNSTRGIICESCFESEGFGQCIHCDVAVPSSDISEGRCPVCYVAYHSGSEAEPTPSDVSKVRRSIPPVSFNHDGEVDEALKDPDSEL